ncbi:MAG: cytochrome b N-terminal domain-containing protein [Candidatus Marinimicrobia bacterium]|nr:cytochrome b N-terminal domain-containing protein [Candidatus Neomarinimicrobiota bacterium]
MKAKLISLWRKIIWPWSPNSDREASESVVKNFWLHWFPSRISLRSISWSYSLWLGTISACLFVILIITGFLLLFFYVPSVQQAYWSIKDIENIVNFGWLLRAQHRWAAELMVAVVFLHLVRVFFTAAYRTPRVWNWYIGIALFILTLFLSFSGYILPWDQLAYWALTIATGIAGEFPWLGKGIRFLLLGGNTIGQSSLIRFYALHNFFLPALLLIFFALHMWRIRKDGGLASMDQLIQQTRLKEIPISSTKTYSLLGVTEGTNIQVETTEVLDKNNSMHTSPDLTRRIALVFLVTTIVTLVLALVSPAPLEEHANPSVTPIPAKAPWYFLWLQELTAVTTFRIKNITISGGLIGGIIVPGLLFLLALVWPFLDKSPKEAIGVWFHKKRKIQNIVFSIGCLAIIVLIIIGVYLRGPYWIFIWPWQSFPEIPSLF